MSQVTGTPLEPAPPPTPARRAWYRRPILIVPLVLVVAAAVAATLVLVLTPQKITVRGIVADQLTGHPVAAAHVHAGQVSATTGTGGTFRMDGVAADSTLSVAARYYATAKVKATTAPLTVRLMPVPVRIMVASALTSRPLAATLTMPDGVKVQARADGTATLYYIGPGEAVAVTAPGYWTAHAVISSGNTANVAIEPTQATMNAQLQAWDRSRNYQAIINWVLRPATGYTFDGTISPEAGGPKSDSATAYFGGGYVPANGVSVGIQISWPGQSWDTAGLEGAFAGEQMHRVTLAGQQAWHGKLDSHTFNTVWWYGPVLVSANGADQAKVDAVMTGIITAMNGTAHDG